MAKQVTDHLGNTFKSIMAMCKYWNVDSTTYTFRIKQGKTIEEALTQTPDRTCKDHLGQTFKSVNAMCKYWNVNKTTYNIRIKQGKTIEEALTQTPDHTCKDHLGQTFKSTNAMCKYWNVNNMTYKLRIEHGMSVEEALTYDSTCQDPYGNIFQSKTEMGQAYGVTQNKMYNMKKSLIEQLNIIPMLTCCIKNYTFDTHLTILTAVNHTINRKYAPKYFACIFDGHEVMLTYKTLIDYCMENLPEDKNPMKKA